MYKYISLCININIYHYEFPFKHSFHLPPPFSMSSLYYNSVLYFVSILISIVISSLT